MMRVDILTLFPEMFRGPFEESIIRRAVDRELVQIGLVNIRDFGLGRHRVVDDYAYGGGPGMLMRPEPLFEAVESVRGADGRVILLSPQGRVFSQQIAAELAGHSHLVLVCGRYEGVDERVRAHLVEDEVSIGDYVLTGGELAAMVVVDAVVRLLPGVLGGELSATDESFSAGLLEYPQYTRPPDYRGLSVPEVLLSGNHGQIARWRHRQAILRTLRRRPDLLSAEDWEVARREGLLDESHGE